MPVCFAITKDGFGKCPMLSPHCKFDLKIGSMSKEVLSGVSCHAAARNLEVKWIWWCRLGIKNCLFRVKEKSSNIDEDSAALASRAHCVPSLSEDCNGRNRWWWPRQDPAVIIVHVFETIRLPEHPVVSTDWEMPAEQGTAQTQLPPPCPGRVMPVWAVRRGFKCTDNRGGTAGPGLLLRRPCCSRRTLNLAVIFKHVIISVWVNAASYRHPAKHVLKCFKV